MLFSCRNGFHDIDRSDKHRVDVVRWNRSREIRCGRVGCSLNLTLDDIHDGACNGRRVERRSVGGHAYWVRFKSARVPTAHFASIVFKSSVPSFLVFPFVRPAICRPLFACTRTHAIRWKKNSASRRCIERRIPCTRITRRGYLLSTSSLGEKIVLRACFGSTSIKTRRNASEQLRDKNVTRIVFIGNRM